MTIGERIKQIRKKLGLSQSAFAKAIGAPGKQSVSFLEKNRVRASVDILITISKIAGCSIQWLATGDDVSTPITPDPASGQNFYIMYDGFSYATLFADSSQDAHNKTRILNPYFGQNIRPYLVIEKAVLRLLMEQSSVQSSPVTPGFCALHTPFSLLLTTIAYCLLPNA